MKILKYATSAYAALGIEVGLTMVLWILLVLVTENLSPRRCLPLGP